MNEIKQLEDMCAAVPAPSRDRLAAARARLLAAAGPAGGRARRQRGRLSARRWLAPLGAAAAVTAAAVVAAIVLPAGAVPQRRTGPTLTAATVLHRAALAALSAPVPRGDRYLYTESEFLNPGGSPAGRIKQWQSLDGSGLTMQWINPCSRRARDCAPYLLSFLVPRARDIFTYAGLGKLPTAPGALLSYLAGEQARACPAVGVPVNSPLLPIDLPTREWSGIGTILQDVPLLPPRFGAALFGAAARIPGARVILNVRDVTGESGIAVARALPEGRPDKGAPESAAFIFRPRTYQYMGEAFDYPGGTTQLGLLASGFVRTAPAASHVANKRPLVPGTGMTCGLWG